MGKSVHIQDITFRYPGSRNPILESFSLTLNPGQIISLVGPSGCGKSTLLRLLAGLEKPNIGEIHFDQKLVTSPSFSLPPEKRSLGFVSQNGDLFPHLTVAKNIAYGLHRKKSKDRRARVAELLEAIDLPEIGKRFPSELSGGECQRVALARSLAPAPDLLLLDEPYSSLDQELREHLRNLTTSLLKNTKTTTLFVTHHQDDALASGDQIVQMEKK